jgi:WD40-like Beta Propeller Repeat
MRNSGIWPVPATVLALAIFFVSGCDLVVRTSVDGVGSGEPDGASTELALSGDGRFAAFASSATNLLAGDTNGSSDIFVRDHQTGTTELISVNTTGGFGTGFSERPDISPDGRYVVFASFANDLSVNDTNPGPDVFLRDRQTNTTELISVDSNANAGSMAPLVAPCQTMDAMLPFIPLTSLTVTLTMMPTSICATVC